jgi:hypothetical protein
MIYIKKGWKRYPIINSPISKLYLVDLINKYPHGFYIRTGKKLKFFKNQLDYKKFDIKIDFFNSIKVLGLIVSVYYFFSLKKKVKEKIKTKNSYVEDRLNEIRETIKKKGQINNDPFGDGEEE